MLDLNHRPKPSELLSELIDTARKAEGDRQPPRQYLGPSALGHEGSCLRQIQYGYMGLPDPKDGRLYRLFDYGHWAEEKTVAEMRAAGFVIVNMRKDGRGQIGFSTAGGKFRGHCDGVLVEGPAEFGPYPRLFEHKALGKYGKTDSFAKVRKDGLRAAKPEYYAQVQTYMAYLDLADNPALFVARHRDTQEIYCEDVPFDPACAQAMSDRAALIIQATDAGEMLPRITDDPASFSCRFCAFADTCWGRA